MREIRLPMTTKEASVVSKQVGVLMKTWGAASYREVVLRAIAEAAERDVVANR